VPGAQHIGGSDIAGAHRTKILGSRKRREGT
jgi:hypothetical protein